MNFAPIYFTCFSLLLFGSLEAQNTHKPLRKGDRAYEREQYKSAEKQYRIAADRDVNNPQALYNLGNSLYQQGDFVGAQQRFQQAATASKNPAHEADALHNLGDSLLKQRKFKDALRAYEQSLRLRPGDSGTKQNLQMAKKKLREEEQKEQEQQQKNQQQQEQENQIQNQNQEQQQNPQNQKDKPQDQTSQPQENQQGQPQQPDQGQQKRQEEQRLKKEDAKRLLETAIEPTDRKNAQKYRAAQQQSKPKGSKKDW